MTLNGVMAVILPYLTELCSYEGQLRHTDQSHAHTVSAIKKSTFSVMYECDDILRAL